MHFLYILERDKTTDLGTFHKFRVEDIPRMLYMKDTKELLTRVLDSMIELKKIQLYVFDKKNKSLNAFVERCDKIKKSPNLKDISKLIDNFPTRLLFDDCMFLTFDPHIHFSFYTNENKLCNVNISRNCIKSDFLRYNTEEMEYINVEKLEHSKILKDFVFKQYNLYEFDCFVIPFLLDNKLSLFDANIIKLVKSYCY